MGTGFYIAQGVSVLTGIVAILMMQTKSMKKMLMGQIFANLLTASTYFLLDGFSGAGICFIAILQSVVMFLYNVKEKKPHLWVIIAFMALYMGCSAFYYKDLVDLLSAAAAICFAASVVQTKSSYARLWYLFNPLLWIIYDIFTKAYVNIIIHSVIFVSTFIAILRNDISKKDKKEVLS